MTEGIPADPLAPPPPAGVRRETPSVSPEGKTVADRTGVYLPWKWVAAVGGFFIASGALWTALGLAKVEDLSDHNISKTAHPVILEKDSEPVPVAAAIRAQHVAAKAHRAEYEELKQGYEIIATVKVDLDTDRAERLADRAADKIRNPRQSREVWKTVRDRALENLQAEPKRPIRSGLEHYLE